MSEQDAGSAATFEEAPEDRSEPLIEFLYRIPLGLVEARADGTIEMINPKSAQLLMPLCASGDFENIFDVLAPFHPGLRALVDGFGEAAGVICDSLRIGVDVETAPVSARILSIGITKLDHDRLMIVLADATADTERERANLAIELRRATRLDAVTSMPNRVAILERVQVVLDREPIDTGYEFALIHIHCDRFRQLGDSFGHQVGDEVVALMAGRLRATLRPTDHISAPHGNQPIAARVSGDEFVVLIDDMRHPADIHVIAGRLVDALSRPYVVASHQIFLTVSIGITGRRHAPPDAELLLQDASIASSTIARAGAARYALFEPGMRREAIVRQALETDLRKALAERQFFVVYQPVVCLGDSHGADCSPGVEALVRWRHPTRGIVPPVDFIPVAEEIGLIGALGEFVLRESCRQLVEWQRGLGDRAPRMMSVNVSRAQLSSGTFVESVAAIVVETGIDPKHLQLEITESLAAQDEQVQARLHELKAMGLTLALDDFGTGYSSLSSLHLLPVDTVKIDRSFVVLSETSPHHRVLIEATIRVARSLGMSTVAEGVETTGQAAIVAGIGCDKGQGYLFSRPMPAADATTWLIHNDLFAGDPPTAQVA